MHTFPKSPNPDWLIFWLCVGVALFGFLMGKANGEEPSHTLQYCQRRELVLAPYGVYEDPMGRGLVVWCVGKEGYKELKDEEKPKDWALPLKESAERFCETEFGSSFFYMNEETGEIWCKGVDGKA